MVFRGNQFTLIITILVALIYSCSSMANDDKDSVMVFVSFSMPNDSIQQWMGAADRHHASVLIRGLVNNSFRDTTAKVLSIVKGNEGQIIGTGVLLDPVAFQKYNINRVPAVVVTHGNAFDVIYGEVSLRFALNKIADRGDCVSSVARQALQQWTRHA